MGVPHDYGNLEIPIASPKIHWKSPRRNERHSHLRGHLFCCELQHRLEGGFVQGGHPTPSEDVEKNRRCEPLREKHGHVTCESLFYHNFSRIR